MTAVHIVSYSELDTYRQCPHKHELAYKERWKSTKPSPALTRGTAWHAMMEDLYGAIKQFRGKPEFSNEEVLEIGRTAAMKTLADATLAVEDDRELLQWMFDGYVEYYGVDPEYRILAIEHPIQLWLPTPKGTRSRIRIKGKLDLVVKDVRTGYIWVVDHKTGANLPHEKALELQDQFALYIWGLRKAGKDVIGAMHNAARTTRNLGDLPPDELERVNIARTEGRKAEGKKPLQKLVPQTMEQRFHRTRLSRTDAELEVMAHEAYTTMRTAYGYKPGEAPRSPNEDTCRWRCDFTDACIMGRKGLDEREFLVDTGFIQDFTRH